MEELKKKEISEIMTERLWTYMEANLSLLLACPERALSLGMNMLDKVSNMNRN